MSRIVALAIILAAGVATAESQKEYCERLAKQAMLECLENKCNNGGYKDLGFATWEDCKYACAYTTAEHLSACKAQ